MRTRPRDNHDRLCAESNLGNVCRCVGKLAEAAEALARVLAATKRANGEDGADTLCTANMLTATYKSEGWHAEAEELEVWLLAVHSRLHGKEDPDALDATANLAIAATCNSQGKCAEAEVLHAAVLAAHSRLNSKWDPAMLTAAYNLAVTYATRGKPADAEELQVGQVGTLAVSRWVLGPEHSETLRIAYNLAPTYVNLGKFAEAEALLAKVLPVGRRARGVAHSETLRMRHSLRVHSEVARTYVDLGQRTKGEYCTSTRWRSTGVCEGRRTQPRSALPATWHAHATTRAGTLTRASYR